jgi:hypothetical protein
VASCEGEQVDAGAGTAEAPDAEDLPAVARGLDGVFQVVSADVVEDHLGPNSYQAMDQHTAKKVLLTL